MEINKSLSRSAIVVSKTMYEAMRLLNENQGQMTLPELKRRISQNLVFTEWEKAQPSESSKMTRWELNMSCYAVEYEVAGFIARDKGIWYLTGMGAKQLVQSPERLFAAAHTAYRISKRENAKFEQIDEDVPEITEPSARTRLEEAEAAAMDGLCQYVSTVDWQEFQKMVAALLRGMGYYVPFIAPQGPDGGLDVLAYESTSGAGQRIFVQAKRFRGTSVSVDVVRSLAALLQKDSDTGMVVTSGKFTSEAIRFSHSCKFNLRLIDLTEFIRLWITYYDRLTPPERDLLPIQPIYFLAK